MSKAKQKVLLEILTGEFFQESFKEVLGGANFFKTNIISVKHALEAAYEAGMQAGIEKAKKK